MVQQPSAVMTLEEALYICLIIAFLFTWLFGGIIAFHWFLRRSVDRWVQKTYEFFAEDDDAQKHKAWVVEKAGELWNRITIREGR